MCKHIFFLFLLLVPGAYANTISFTDYGLSSQEIDIYYPNGTIVDTVKSNGSISLDSASDYQFVFRPEKISILDDPRILLEWAWAFLPVLLSVAFIIILAGLLGFKRFKFW